MSASAVSLPAFVAPADLAYARFEQINNVTGQIPSMAVYEAAELGFLNTPADTAVGIVRKLRLAEFYLDETCEYADRDVTRVVISLVLANELDNALRYARAIVASETIENYSANPIKAAIADMERMETTA